MAGEDRTQPEDPHDPAAERGRAARDRARPRPRALGRRARAVPEPDGGHARRARRDRRRALRPARRARGPRMVGAQRRREPARRLVRALRDPHARGRPARGAALRGQGQRDGGGPAAAERIARCSRAMSRRWTRRSSRACSTRAPRSRQGALREPLPLGREPHEHARPRAQSAAARPLRGRLVVGLRGGRRRGRRRARDRRRPGRIDPRFPRRCAAWSE